MTPYRLVEPNWVACAECGVMTAEMAAGRTICFACSEKSAAAAQAAIEFSQSCPREFAWADFRAPELAQRTPGEARRKAAHAVGSVRVAIIGPSGAGKTSLAVAMARRWAVLKGRAPLVAGAPRLGASRLRSHGESEIAQALEASLLVLDDLGTEKELPSSPITELIHERHAYGLPTWVTTWMNDAEVTARYGAGIARRVFEGAVVIDCGEGR